MTIQVTLDNEVVFRYAEDEHSEEDGAHSEEADEGIVNPVIPEINEIFWAALFFFALWALMKWVLLPPLMAGREERANKIRAARDAAGSVDADLGEATSNYDAKISAAREEANSIVATAREEADAHRRELQAAADAEIADLRASADGELAQARANALNQMRGDVGDLAVDAAGKVIGADLDRQAQQSIIDRVLNS